MNFRSFFLYGHLGLVFGPGECEYHIVKGGPETIGAERWMHLSTLLILRSFFRLKILNIFKPSMLSGETFCVYTKNVFLYSSMRIDNRRGWISIINIFTNYKLNYESIMGEGMNPLWILDIGP